MLRLRVHMLLQPKTLQHSQINTEVLQNKNNVINAYLTTVLGLTLLGGWLRGDQEGFLFHCRKPRDDVYT